MAMPAMVPRYTVDDLDSFPNDGNRYELLDGVLLVTPAPLPPHEFVVNRIRDQLTHYLGTQAHVLSRGAVQVRPRHHLEPDLLVLPATGRVPLHWSDVHTFWLAVEVSGRGSRIYDRDFKHAAYQSLGVREVWRADLFDHRIEVIREGTDHVAVVTDWLTWQAPGLTTALRFNVPAIFDGIDTDE